MMEKIVKNRWFLSPKRKQNLKSVPNPSESWCRSQFPFCFLLCEPQGFPLKCLFDLFGCRFFDSGESTKDSKDYWTWSARSMRDAFFLYISLMSVLPFNSCTSWCWIRVEAPNPNQLGCKNAAAKADAPREPTQRPWVRIPCANLLVTWKKTSNHWFSHILSPYWGTWHNSLCETQGCWSLTWLTKLAVRSQPVLTEQASGTKKKHQGSSFRMQNLSTLLS